jgi:anti-sigma B factor antagonist
MSAEAFGAGEATFDLRRHRVGGSVRVTVLGELDLQTERALVAEVDAALEGGGVAQLVLDVTGVQFIDSSGLRSLLMCRDRARRDGAAVLLAVESGPVTALLDVAGVGDWFSYE